MGHHAPNQRIIPWTPRSYSHVKYRVPRIVDEFALRLLSVISSPYLSRGWYFAYAVDVERTIRPLLEGIDSLGALRIMEGGEVRHSSRRGIAAVTEANSVLMPYDMIINVRKVYLQCFGPRLTGFVRQ